MSTPHQQYSVLAPLIQLNWKASDLQLTSSALRPTPTTTPPPEPSTRLSTGAKAAIGVVIPVVVLAAVALLIAILRRRKKRSVPPHEQQYQEKPELDASNTLKHASKSTGVSELVASDGRHMLGSEPQYELPAPNIVHELEGLERGSIDNSDGNQV